ncbi:hypothetical protein HL658_12110 [Azospirillum sp. RWY-5-1]|uniref:Transposase (putative) YhgA-like domain-containing protein n=1 Tax=Azospirillum oleiclasticum TaxID=2735135 RepID=A0ABX2T854_9PROT|nr:Rpn family recombination-promoting nuclease/putative transposase [Azospirillum oleiclasticum]NYZ13297.1 hypothetical protein [Azospirillum oleiclasticum]NYZ20458.1 hypothetical protein [Azospirillum oleiclasticum]
MTDADSLYHRLFSLPVMVEELVKIFVPLPLQAGFGFDGMERVNAKHHAARSGLRRESDVIWRLRSSTGADLFLYLMLEFQSRPDRWMALRATVYQGLLWQQIIAERGLKAGDRLPPVLMVVLHNGETRWNAPTELAELIGLPDHSPLWLWQPQGRYHLLDMGSFDRDILSGFDSPAALLVRLEQGHDDPAAMELLVEQAIAWFQRHPDCAPLRALFSELMMQAIRDFGSSTAASDMTEVRTMLATQAQRWMEKWKSQGLAEGRAEGIAEGRAEGRAKGRAEGRAEGRVEGIAEGRVEGTIEGRSQGRMEGKIEAIIAAIDTRFGASSSTIDARVRATAPDELDNLLRRVLTAESLDAALDLPAQH